MGRFAASVLIVSGALCLVDAAVTLLWQEPISAILGARGQAVLEQQLTEAEGLSAEQYAKRLEPGAAVGRIQLPNVKRNFAFAEGTDVETLRSGPGHYVGTDLPGQGGTVAIAGHRTTYLAPFRKNDQLERGDEIVVEMPYGDFVYSVERQAIVSPTNVQVLDSGSRERLVLTACHPLYSDAQRLIVFASLERMEESSRDSRNSTSATTATSEIATTASQ